jgi:6-phosphogluconolactonase
MPTAPQVRVFPSPAELFRAAAEEFCAIGSRAIYERGRFTVVLSGGSTPRGFHQELVSNFSSTLPWKDVFFFWGDERHVPAESPDSNYRMANETLLSRLPIPADHVFRIPAEMEDADKASQGYEQALRDFFQAASGSFPRFDFVLLGVGTDGHTASLFPGSRALQEDRQWVVANWVEKLKAFRITLTYPVLNHAACVTFLVTGADKAEVVRQALSERAANLPCQKVQPVNGQLMWYLDESAAAKL